MNFTSFRFKLFSPVILKRPAENQLNLLRPVVLRPQQNLDRRANLRQARFGRERTIGPIEPVERRRHFEQLGPDRQKLLIKNVF